ncbi:MAG: Fic family protein [Acidobacteriia bacterium]|nr:Fic family protein [Terriglobia bacterium]
MDTAIQYEVPRSWIKYDHDEIRDELLTAKASILALKAIPFQRRWVKSIQDIQLKMEVGGSSRIEGADFAANELETAIKAETPEELVTRSQRQALATTKAYRWIVNIPDDYPIDVDLVCSIHRIIITDCDEDHCEPGVVRHGDDQVTFGIPKHRGARAGDECKDALQQLTEEVKTTYRNHDALVQALALHYHFAAMHPFVDGNGRTARVLEALALQRAGLKDSLFIAMSNYYYDEKKDYLSSLAAVRAGDHNLTAFLKFGLKGIALQTQRLTNLVKNAVSKELFRGLMGDLFSRLESTRKRVIVKRQLMVLNRLLERDGEQEVEWSQLVDEVARYYASRKNASTAIVRDVNRLGALGAITVRREQIDEKRSRFWIGANLNWPSQITDTEFFMKIEQLPRSKTSTFPTPTTNGL